MTAVRFGDPGRPNGHIGRALPRPGLRRLTRDTCDEIAGLAMPGLMESLNVSAAATVALYELRRVS